MRLFLCSGRAQSGGFFHHERARLIVNICFVCWTCIGKPGDAAQLECWMALYEHPRNESGTVPFDSRRLPRGASICEIHYYAQLARQAHADVDTYSPSI